MTAPISQITVYSNASVLGSTLVTVGTFPVDNSSQRSATLRGENCVKICFRAGQSIAIPAFSFIEYDGQLFFLKETYRPVPKGNSYYEYNMKFVSFDNMLSKPQAYRKVVVDGETWNEPDIDVVGNLADIATVIKDSIIETAGRYEGVFADMLSKVELVDAEININSESKAFSYSGQKISQVLDAIANEYEIDYWFEQAGDTQNGITKMILHFAKCEILSGDLHVTDKTSPSDPFDKLHPTVSGGLDECTFSNEWSGVVQRITPFGSERNIKRGQAIANDMFVSFGKRLRLDYDHSCTIDGTTYQHAYAVKNEGGELEPLYVDENGAVYVPGVTTGEETIEKYDDIYPRGHFRVTHVTQRGVDTQIYTVYAIPTVERDGQFVDLTDAEIDAMQADPTKKLFPIDIADGQTLSLHFESGYLNGREFEVANKTAKMTWNGSAYEVDPDNGHWVACFEINPEGDNNDSPQVPYGNLIPRGKFDSTTGYEGDMFAIFNMDMPAFYVEDAQNELAQKAYDEIVSILATRPEVKCKGNEVYFKNHSLFLGQRIFVKSDLFGQDNKGQPLEFISRVTNYSYPLSKPNNVDFRLCSSRVQSAISVMKGAIADQTNDIMGVGQTARSLSRRAFRDAQEMIGMLQAVVAEIMVVGVERYQFQFTMGIECLKATGSDGIMHFDGLKITAGELQHTQEPYIKDAWEGHYSLLSETTLKADHNGNAIDKSATDTYRNTPYYLYAVINSSTGQVSMELWADKKDGENEKAYLLLGILSSEFLDGNTSLRVFNKSNGFTQIAGGTITTEQLQDPTRQLIIDMSSNPPRIIAKRGAQIIGNITFISSDGAETNLATKMNNVDEELAKEIGGENLYSGVDPWQIITTTKDTDIVLENGKKYVISVAAIDGDAWGLLAKEKIGSAYSNLGWIVKDGSIGTMQHYEKKTLVVTGHGGKLALQVTSSGSDYYYTLTGIMVQQGEKPTTYQPTYKYLAEAFEHDATKMTTSIDGGLIIAALMKLMNVHGNITAGISGLDDGLVLWGGGTYAQALSDLAGTTDILPVLLTTNQYGTGTKLGIFKIKKDVSGNHYIQVDDEGTPSILFYNDRSAHEVISQLSPITTFPAGSVQQTDEIKSEVYFYYNDHTENRWTYYHSVNGSVVERSHNNYGYSLDDSKDLLVQQLVLEPSPYTFKAKVNFNPQIGATTAGSYVAGASASVKVLLTISNVTTGEIVGQKTFYAEPGVGRSYSIDFDIEKTFTVPSKGTYMIYIEAEIHLTTNGTPAYHTPQTDISDYGVAQGFVKFLGGTLTNTSSRTVLCKDGFVFMCGGYNFTLRRNALNLDLRAQGLPDSDPHVVGQFYTQNQTIGGTAQKVLCVSAG